MNKEICKYHKQILAPMGMACLLKFGEERRTADRLNIVRFSDEEIRNMKGGIMAFRHFIYDGYCQEIPFSYNNPPRNPSKVIEKLSTETYCI